MKKQHLEALTIKENGELVAIASTENKDRVGDALLLEDWDLKNFRKNPVLQAGHDYNPHYTIGIAKKMRIEGNKLIFTPQFHTITQLAREIKEMYEQGILKAWSVGFIPNALHTDADGKKLGKNELLEVSAVAIPANAEALMASAKSYSEDKVKEIEKFIKKEVEKKAVVSIETGIKNDHIHVAKVDEETGDGQTGIPKGETEGHTHDIKKFVVQEAEGHNHSLEKPKSADEEKPKKEIDNIEVRGVIPYRNLGQAEINTAWDGGKEVKKASVEDLLIMSAWFDTEKRETKGAYKLPHHSASGKHVAIWNGVKSAMGALLGARGGVNVPNDDRKGIYNHLKKHYTEFDKKAPEFKEIEETKSIQAWNKTLPKIFNKEFDISEIPSRPTGFEYTLYTKYLECQVKDISVNLFDIPSTVLGSYLSAIKTTLGNHSLIDERNFIYGTEYPLVYEVIKVNSKEDDDFLIQGTRFYKAKDGTAFIIKFDPGWFGLNISIVTTHTNREWNKKLLKTIRKEYKDNNKLKGEILSISGEFLSKGENKWDELVLPEMTKSSITKSIKQLTDKKEKATSRGMMFIGPPGTGKTKTGKIIMDNSKDTTYLWVSGRDFEKVHEQRVLTLAFDLARQLAPTVLFMEDIDTWLKGYCIDLLKTELDGLKENKGLITILTSNEPENFPDALLDRPGRFHDILEFNLPDKSLREEMIKKWTGINNIDIKILNQIVKETEGFSGAHMKELIDFAKMIKEEENLDIIKSLLKSLEKLKAQRRLIAKIRKNKKNEIEEKSFGIKKEGRVLSGKNRSLITKTVESLNITTAALEKLLEATESNRPVEGKQTPEQKAKGSGNTKTVEKPKIVKEQTNEVDVVLHALRKIAGNANKALQVQKRKQN